MRLIINYYVEVQKLILTNILQSVAKILRSIIFKLELKYKTKK